jgi:hypothetical protein
MDVSRSLLDYAGPPLTLAARTSLAVLLGLLLAPAAASATVSPTRAPGDLAAAIDGTATTGASFDAIPPNGAPAAVADEPLASFPTSGSSYAVLSTGNATFADNVNLSGSDTENNGGGHVSGRGGNDFDVVVLRIGVNVPGGTNCLSFDFRFLTEEFPEHIGQTVNDAFIAELDGSSWTTSADGTVTAPGNFAFDPAGRQISVNASGETSMSSADASGTTYDGGTPLLRASTSVSAGAHTLFLSVFDQGDAILDSAAFVDNLTFTQEPPGGCVSGARRAPEPVGPKTLADLPLPTLGKTVNVAAVAGRVLVALPRRAGGVSARASQKGLRFVPLEEARQIPTGSFLDTRRGTVRLVSRRPGRAGNTQVGDFSSGLIQALQSRRRRDRGLTDLVLKGASFRRCLGVELGGGPILAPIRASGLSRRTIRRLRANARGRFRTSGRNSSATVRGTEWIVTDRCDGTLTRVRRGSVVVRDFRRRRNVIVRAGKSYLARPPRGR